MSRTHYETLGVREDAEIQVIRAAYKALAQMYHPDKYPGDKAEANKKMAGLNIAYEILSDPIKRSAYDAEIRVAAEAERHHTRSNRGNDGSDSRSEKQGSTREVDPWVIAAKVYPEIVTYYQDLMIMNSALARDFKERLLQTKRFKDAQAVASRMMDSFLSRYFGESDEIKTFAIQVLRSGNKAMARYLNEIVAALGPSATIDAVRTLFSERFPHHIKVLNDMLVDPIMTEQIKKGRLTIEQAIALIQSLGGKVANDGSDRFSATVNGTSETGMSANYFRSRFLQDALLRKSD